MESACLRHTMIPHTSRLFADFTYHFERVAQFYGHSPEDFTRAAEELDYQDARRASLVDALREQNGDTPLLDSLAQPGTVAVVTGQQAGLFTGPAYTVYKALTAVRLARELTRRGMNAVPVFWLATEDHDFAEVAKAWTFDSGHRPVELEVAGPGVSQRPVGSIRPDSFPTAELAGSLRGFPHGSEISEMVARSYRPGATLCDAFKALLQSILGDYDLLYVDPLRPAVRNIGAPLLARALEDAGDLKTSLLERNRALEAAGYHAQVHLEPQTSLFFLLEDARRMTLRRQDNEYVSKDRRYSPDALANRASDLSPNALLRPVMQDYILPTVAYIGGPAEMAYLGQSEVIYRTLLGRMPVVRPRAGFTLLDARAAKLLARYQLDLTDVFEGADPLCERIARTLVPEHVGKAFHATAAEVGARIERLESELKSFDPTLSVALEKSRSKILHQIGKLERKVARETMRRHERAQSDAAFLTNLVFPHRHLQERLYCILPFLAQHGMDLIGKLYDNVHLDCHDHQVLTV